MDAAITTGTFRSSPASSTPPAAAQNSILQAVKGAQVETTANGKIKVTSGYKCMALLLDLIQEVVELV